MIFIDLDDCLVDTRELRPYRTTAEGRVYIPRHVSEITTIPFRGMREIVISLHRQGQATIFTNAPLEYVKAVLGHHGYPSDILIAPAASKPLSYKLDAALQDANCDPSQALVVDDSAAGIITAHGSRVTAIATAWGYSTRRQLEQAEPAAIADKPGDLENLIIQWQKGNLHYTPRTEPDRYMFLPESEFNIESPEVQFLSCFPYYPRGSAYFDENSGRILDFKDSKKVSIEDLNAGHVGRYFWNGMLRQGRVYRQVFFSFVRSASRKLSEVGLEDDVLIIAAPNSAPSFCYKTDINLKLVHHLAKGTKHRIPEHRLVNRVYPVPDAHNLGERSSEKHLKTIGYLQQEIGNPDSTIIFDDVTTSGTSIMAIAKILRYFGVNGKFYGLTLGQTQSQTFL